MRLYTLDGRFNLCGKRVREARIKAGMSQDTLAAKLQLAGLQIGQMAVSRIETGNAKTRVKITCYSDRFHVKCIIRYFGQVCAIARRCFEFSKEDYHAVD